MTDTDQIIKYVRLNLSTLKAMLKRPNALKDIHKKLKAEMPKGELADLLAPLIVQRAQGTIQESGLKRGIESVLGSMPAKQEEEEFREEQLRQQQILQHRRVKVGGTTPYCLSRFRDDHVNQVAAELFDRYSRQFSVGQAIAMTRRDLNKTDLDLTTLPRPARDISAPKPAPTAPTFPSGNEPEPQSLFTRDDIKYAAGVQIRPMRYSDLVEACEVAYESFKATVDWPKEELVNYLETWTYVPVSWVAEDNGRIVGGYCINDRPLNMEKLKGLNGLQGLALFVLPEYRGTGLGRQLREKIKATHPDYVWGQHLESLNNLNKWISYGREYVGTEDGVHFTLQMLKDPKTASEDDEFSITSARQPAPPGAALVIREGSTGVRFIIAPEEELAKKGSDLFPTEFLAIGNLDTRPGPYWNFHSQATKGFGPLLYDVGMIYATSKGKWVGSSILLGGYTSPKAQAVWEYYYKHRPDVQKKDLSGTSFVTDNQYRDEIANKPWLMCVYQLHGNIESLVPVYKRSPGPDDGSKPKQEPKPRAASTRKLSYVVKVPGHRNSKGEAAPWCIRSHETGEILSSHKTEAEAKEHLRQMHIHKGADEGKLVWPRRINKRESVLAKINGTGEKDQFQAHEFNMPPEWIDEFLSRPVYVVKDKNGTEELKPGNRIGLLGSIQIGPEGRTTTETRRGHRHPYQLRGPRFLFLYAAVTLGAGPSDDLVTVFPILERERALGFKQHPLDPAKVRDFLNKGRTGAPKTGYTRGEESTMFIEKRGTEQTVFLTHAEADALLPKGKTASKMTDTEYWAAVEHEVAQMYPGHKLGFYDDGKLETEDI